MFVRLYPSAPCLNPPPPPEVLLGTRGATTVWLLLDGLRAAFRSRMSKARMEIKKRKLKKESSSKSPSESVVLNNVVGRTSELESVRASSERSATPLRKGGADKNEKMPSTGKTILREFVHPTADAALRHAPPPILPADSTLKPLATEAAAAAVNPSFASANSARGTPYSRKHRTYTQATTTNTRKKPFHEDIMSVLESNRPEVHHTYNVSMWTDIVHW